MKIIAIYKLSMENYYYLYLHRQELSPKYGGLSHATFRVSLVI